MFDETRLPTTISLGAIGGPMWPSTSSVLKSGLEYRNTTWSEPIHKYNLGYGIRNIDDAFDIIDFFEARGGALRGFRFKDWTDYKSCPPSTTVTNTDVTIGTGDNSTTTFQLIKTYGTHTRTITKPVSGTVVISLDDASQASGWSVDTVTGIVTFDTAPGTDVVVKAGFEFDVPVKFTNDNIEIEVNDTYLSSIPNITLMEIRI